MRWCVRETFISYLTKIQYAPIQAIYCVSGVTKTLKNCSILYSGTDHTVCNSYVPLTPKVGPWEGCLRQAKELMLRCAVRAWTRPTVTVLFPSPKGVGVILAKQEKRLIKFFADVSLAEDIRTYSFWFQWRIFVQQISIRLLYHHKNTATMLSPSSSWNANIHVSSI